MTSHGTVGAVPSADYSQDTTDNDAPIRIRARARAVLSNPTTNRGTAFTHEERSALGLVGLIPSGVTTLENQTRRTYEQFRRGSTPLAKYLHLAQLRDRNEVLFYNLLSGHLEEMLPIVYTPTIGEAIERFSHEYNRPRGVFLSIDDPDGVETALLNYGLEPDEVDLLVVTDSEGILGIGDQGIGGIQIAIGKASVYTAAAGIHPRRIIPVVLDVGTDNLGLLNNELYLGVPHARVRGQRYDDFVEHFITTASRLFPKAMIHWEDFGPGNAHRLLARYRDRVCTFNDDIQGTAAVVLAAILAAVDVTGIDLEDQRVVVFGAGSAGIGIADLVRDTMLRSGRIGSPEAAYDRFWAIGINGLYVDDQPELMTFQRSPRSRACSSTTSPSSSPRSPTRPWTPSARSSSPRSAPRSVPRATCSTAARRTCARSSSTSRSSTTTSSPRSSTSTPTVTSRATPRSSSRASTTPAAGKRHCAPDWTRSAERCRRRSRRVHASSSSATATPTATTRRSPPCCSPPRSTTT